MKESDLLRAMEGLQEAEGTADSRTLARVLRVRPSFARAWLEAGKVGLSKRAEVRFLAECADSGALGLAILAGVLSNPGFMDRGQVGVLEAAYEGGFDFGGDLAGITKESVEKAMALGSAAAAKVLKTPTQSGLYTGLRTCDVHWRPAACCETPQVNPPWPDPWPSSSEMGRLLSGPADEVRAKFPRRHCSSCGSILYASFEHYLAGDY